MNEKQEAPRQKRRQVHGGEETCWQCFGKSPDLYTSLPDHGHTFYKWLAVHTKAVGDVCECAEVANIVAGSWSWNANLPPAI